MHNMTVQDVRLAVGGEWIRRPDDADGNEAEDSSRALAVTFGAVCTDTRRIVPGDVFVALKGDRFDGADYLHEAQSRGARCLITHRVPVEFTPKVPTIVVRDSLKALGRLARASRDLQRACIVGITGSNGKTTTREMTSAILKRNFTVLQNTANENNRIGVPKTLLRLSERHEFAVIEMGTSEPGEIRELARIAGPQCGVLTSISESHLSGLGSLEGVIKEKSELLAAIPRDGIAIVNFDDPRCVKAAERANCRVVSYGTDMRCELRAEDIRTNRYGTHFMLNGRHDFRLPLHGEHNVMNALAAIAVGWVSGVNIGDMQLALRRIEPVGRRLEYHEYAGIGLLDDSYNANPASTCAALKTLGSFPCDGQRIAVLGDMLELGDESERLHREVGWLGTTQPVDLVIAVGKEMRALADVFDEHFFETGRGCVWRFDTSEEAAKHLLAESRAGDLLLVKGSNGMKMNRIVEAFRKRYEEAEDGKLRPTTRERPIGDPLPELIRSARNSRTAAA
ncbi:MAG: UDP-N-acetylmuramoyl-tripeptide--D-alanyl-D-alanine ligase [Planctomycetes bacterium]|nr:UDP-N-acetylmuramoyl-tripeptide--D-alanyl-D-alanine ligase [Planctomycetota bacterium]